MGGLMNQIVIIDSYATGFNGEPFRVLAVCHTPSGRIMVKKQANPKESPTKKGDTLVVTDNPRLSHFGLLFNEKLHTKEVIDAYVQANKTNNLQFDDAMRAYDPKGVLQARKMDETGVQYEFDSDTGNGVMAVLLAIWGASMAMRGSQITRAFDDTPLPTPRDMTAFMALPFSV